MKLPRDLSGGQLIGRLQRRFGYRKVHQEGSHIVLQVEAPRRHRVTVPDHKVLRLGTLNVILRAVAQAHGLRKEELAERLLG